ncbi:hypothetical protein QTP88_008858 [Uroleucon formosanum]
MKGGDPRSSTIVVGYPTNRPPPLYDNVCHKRVVWLAETAGRLRSEGTRRTSHRITCYRGIPSCIRFNVIKKKNPS